MADYIRRRLQAAGVRVVTGAGLEEITGEGRAAGVRTGVGSFDGEAVVLAIGVRPATAFLQGSGLKWSAAPSSMDERQRTNLEDVYAVGDARWFATA